MRVAKVGLGMASNAGSTLLSGWKAWPNAGFARQTYPKRFKRPDTVHEPDGSRVVWKPLDKAAGNFRRYQEIARSSKLRCLDALVPVQAPQVGYQQVRPLVQSQQHAGRR